MALELDAAFDAVRDPSVADERRHLALDLAIDCPPFSPRQSGGNCFESTALAVHSGSTLIRFRHFDDWCDRATGCQCARLGMRGQSACNAVACQHGRTFHGQSFLDSCTSLVVGDRLLPTRVAMGRVSSVAASARR